MDDFASTELFNLIALELQKQGYDVRPSPEFKGKISRTAKASLLNAALDDLGPSALLKIGSGIEDVHGKPMVSVLLNAISIPDVIERWQRLEVFFHGNHRVRTLNITEKTISVEHYSLNGNPPSKGEDLVIAGLLSALFKSVGAKKLCLHINNRVVLTDGDIHEDVLDLPSSNLWEYTWSHLDTKAYTNITACKDQNIAQRLASIMSSDIGRSWNLISAAQIMGISTRTMQRKLALCETSFQSILRAERVDRAAIMLLESQYSLLEVGYATGFSDQAHFSREFKLRFNMTPTEYSKLKL